MARLIHLNGPPGIGKSTIARRYVAEHPGVLNCDIDVLRTMIGGWENDFPPSWGSDPSGGARDDSGVPVQRL